MIGLNFASELAMAPDELVQYIALKDLYIDIATKIYPHYKDMYPGGVKDMTALNPELSEEAQQLHKQ